MPTMAESKSSAASLTTAVAPMCPGAHAGGVAHPGFKPRPAVNGDPPFQFTAARSFYGEGAHLGLFAISTRCQLRQSRRVYSTGNGVWWTYKREGVGAGLPAMTTRTHRLRFHSPASRLPQGGRSWCRTYRSGLARDDNVGNNEGEVAEDEPGRRAAPTAH